MLHILYYLCKKSGKISTKKGGGILWYIVVALCGQAGKTSQARCSCMCFVETFKRPLKNQCPVKVSDYPWLLSICQLISDMALKIATE